MKLLKPHLDVGLVTGDAVLARKFYGEILGLRELTARPLGGGTVQHRFLLGSQVVKLLAPPTPPPNFPSDLPDAIGYRRLALRVPDIGEIRDRLRQAGCPLKEMAPRPDATRTFRTRDPDGNTLSLSEGSAGLGIGLSVRDVERSRRFYGEVLGLQEEELASAGAFRAGTSLIALTAARPESPDHTGPPQAAVGIRYMTLAVHGIEALCEELEARGARIAMRPRELGGIVRISFVEDPDGNWIEFGEPL